MDNLNSPEIPEKFAQYADEIKETVKETVRLTLKPTTELKLWQSKVGGEPYLPLTEEYPCNPKGVPLKFLVQINFSEMPHLPRYPEKGILEFYIDGSDDLLGLNLEDLTNKDGFRVLYFDTVEEDESKLYRDTKKLLDESGVGGPLGKDSSFSIDFSLEKQYMTMYDYRFLNAVSFAKDFEIVDEYNETFPAYGHRIGGYPCFTQTDPREGSYSEYELLLQLDSQSFEGPDCIMWGDVGVGAFFIRPDDLEMCDFTKVLYNWDCS